MNKVLLGSGVEQNDSGIHIYLFFSNSSPTYMLLYSSEQSTLWYIVGPNENILIAVGQFVMCQMMGKHVTKKPHLFTSQ